MRLNVIGWQIELKICVKAGTAWAQCILMLPNESYVAQTRRHLDTMQLDAEMRVAMVKCPDDRTEMVRATSGDATFVLHHGV